MRAVGDGVVELADGTSERADQVLVATGAWTAGAARPRPSVRRSRSTSTCGSRRPACRCGRTTSTSTASATTAGRASRSAGTRSAPMSTPTIRRPARRRRPRWSGSPTPPAGACRACRWPRRRASSCAAPTSAATRSTPTEAPIVDRLGERTVVCAGFSGHGFKFAPTVAAAAADLVLGRTPEVELAPFRFPRA